MIRSLSPAFNKLTSFLAANPTQVHTPILILSPSALAPNKMSDVSPHEEQGTALRHLRKLSELLISYPKVYCRLQWLPRNIPFVGFRRTRQLAIRIAGPPKISFPDLHIQLSTMSPQVTLSLGNTPNPSTPDTPQIKLPARVAE